LTLASIFILHKGPGRIAREGINIVEIARGIVGIVEWLGNGATVGGDAEEGLAMFVSPRFGEGGGKLKLNEIMMIGEHGYQRFVLVK
jgi:hypothetical protein